QAITFVGNAVGSGALQISNDKQFLSFVGYDAAPNTANVANSSVNRVVGVVGLDSLVDSTTTIAGGGTIRSAVSRDGRDFWVGGGTAGCRLVTSGPGSAVTTVAGTPASVQTLNITGGQLYETSDTTNFGRVNQVGSGMPTSAGNPVNGLYTGADANVNGFAFL